jgi:hypothetical protein
MSAVMWLIAGVNFTVAFQALPSHDWTHILAGFAALTAGVLL